MKSAGTIDISPVDQRFYADLQQEVDLGVRALTEGNADTAVTFFQSALEKLTVDQPFYDQLVHNLLLGYKLLIDNALKADDLRSADEMAQVVLRFDIAGRMADDAAFRQAFAVAFQEIGLLFFNSRRFATSMACYRKAISIHSSPASHINLTNALRVAGERGLLSDFTTEIGPDQLGRHIFVACVPKSGSTFLKNVLLALTGYRDAFMVTSAWQFEQELHLPALESFATFDTVTQQHCRASDMTVHVMQAFELRPVVLVRNIFDSAVSLLDFYDGGAYMNSYFRADYQSLGENDRIDLIIDNFIPWYFQFVASWTQAERDGRLELMWLTYEELIGDKPAAIAKVLEFYGLGASRRAIEQKIKETEGERRKTRFNKGVAGRGSSRLDDRQKKRIQDLARFYPTTDLSRIGL